MLEITFHSSVFAKPEEQRASGIPELGVERDGADGERVTLDLLRSGCSHDGIFVVVKIFFSYVFLNF